MHDGVDRQGIVRGRSNRLKMAIARDFRKNLTVAESRLWEHLRGNRLDGLHFRRQHAIDGFIVDFYCHKAGVIVEVDGGIHDSQKESDTARDVHLQSRGLRILRVTNNEVLFDIDEVCLRIAALCTPRYRHEPANSSP